MSNVFDEQTSIVSSGTSETVELRDIRYSADRSSHERHSQAYRSDEEPEVDIRQSQFPYDEERQVYVYDAKEEMEKGLPPYGGCCGCSLQSLGVEEKGLSSPESNLHEFEDAEYDDPNLDYTSQHINFGMAYAISYMGKFMYFKNRRRLPISRSTVCCCQYR